MEEEVEKKHTKKINGRNRNSVHAFAGDSKFYFECSFARVFSFISLLNGASLCSVLNYLLDRSPLGIHYQNENAKRNIIFTYGFSACFPPLDTRIHLMCRFFSLHFYYCWAYFFRLIHFAHNFISFAEFLFFRVCQ